MVRNNKLLKCFEREQIKRKDSSYVQNLMFFEDSWKEGVLLGVLPLKDPMDGVEVDITIAKILNSKDD